MDQLGSVWDLASPAPMQAALGGALTSLATLPQKLDQVLTMAADGKANLRVEMVEPPESQKRKDSTAAAIAGILGIVALALVAHQVAALLPNPWGERVAAALLVFVGLLLLPRLVR